MKKAEKYRKEIEKKQNLALLIEATELLETPSINFELNTNYFALDEKEGYRIDIAQSVFKRLINETMTELIKQDFIIDLNDTKIPGFSKEKIGEYKELDSLYEQMIASFSYIRRCKKADKINFIELLLEKKQYDIVVEQLVEDRITPKQKLEIIDVIIKHHAGNIDDIFDTVPLSYYDVHKGKKENQEDFKLILNEKLQQNFNGNEQYIYDIIKSNLKRPCKDWVAVNSVTEVVKFFIERNLININELTWYTEDDIEVTTAAAAYLMGKEDLAMYLYSSKQYLDNNDLLKDNSDIAIAEHIIQYHSFDLEKFISHPNYTNNKEKFFCLIEMIAEKIKCCEEQGNPCKINREAIINILLRKTKKEDYKNIRKELIARKENEKLLEEKRQELTSTLTTLNNYLLENKPAKAKIKDLHLSKQIVE